MIEDPIDRGEGLNERPVRAAADMATPPNPRAELGFAVARERRVIARLRARFEAQGLDFDALLLSVIRRWLAEP